MRSPRYAIAYTPPPSSPLARFGAGVLGYDCFERTEVARPLLHRLDPAMLALATVAPRRCGFHAALVAPFRLVGSHQNDLVAAFGRFAQEYAPVAVGRLDVAVVGCHVALVPAEPDSRITELAAACVRYFDRFAAPPTPPERDQRKNGLTKRQLEFLRRWGDPYVFEEYRFHLRLAGPLADGEAGLFTNALAGAFTGLSGDLVELDAVSLMRQDDPEKRFFVLARQLLTGAP